MLESEAEARDALYSPLFLANCGQRLAKNATVSAGFSFSGTFAESMARPLP